jgi:hypothetical protein
MPEKICSVCRGDGSNCAFKGSLRGQAENGGFKDKNLNIGEDASGPFMTENQWGDLVQRSVRQAKSFDCLCEEELQAFADNLTASKRRKGEFVNQH